MCQKSSILASKNINLNNSILRKCIKTNVSKRVHFSDDTPIVISIDQMSNEEKYNSWYNLSDLLKFRTIARCDAGFIRQYPTNPDSNLLKAYKATTKGNKKSAVMLLELWCSSPSEYSCFRGLEPSFKKGVLEDLKKDRIMSIKDVLRVQNNLVENKLKDYPNYEKTIKDVYKKASRNSKNFAMAMGLADSIEVYGKYALDLKRRSIGNRISKTLRSSIIRQI